MNRNGFTNKRWENYQRVLEKLYVKTRDALNYLSLPKLKDCLVEIPISVPDDEIIIDRLEIVDEREITKIWRKILGETHRRGELFTVQSHHERVPLYKDALRSLLGDVKGLSPKVWIASLKEIAEWWKEKDVFNFKLINTKNDYYNIKANCSERATILVKRPQRNNSLKSLFDNYNIINDKNFSIKSKKKPFIGIAKHTPKELINFLHAEGFMVEIGSKKNDYAIYLENYQSFNTDNEKQLIEIIEDSCYPLIRFWRWPDKAQSALAITGDIDGITIFHFIKRSFQF